MDSPAQGQELALLERFLDAWNDHDVDALMACMADECVFIAAAGSAEHGEEHRGRDAVRVAYQAIFETFPDASWREGKHTVCGAIGVSEWLFMGTGVGGPVAVRGCDLLHLEDGKITLKNSFRKQRA